MIGLLCFLGALGFHRFARLRILSRFCGFHLFGRLCLLCFFYLFCILRLFCSFCGLGRFFLLLGFHRFFLLVLLGFICLGLLGLGILLRLGFLGPASAPLRACFFLTVSFSSAGYTMNSS